MTRREPNSELAAQMSALTELYYSLKNENERLAAQVAQLAIRDTPQLPKWIALKSAPRGPYSYECLRSWCVTGLVEARKQNGRWFVNVASLNARLASLAAV